MNAFEKGSAGEQVWQQLQEAKRCLGHEQALDLAIILGTGMGASLATLQQQGLQVTARIPYTDIAHFPSTTAVTHAGELLLARFKSLHVAVFSGRFHLYEGYTALQVALPVFLAAQMGVKRLVISNAAGGLHSGIPVCSLMRIEDHLNLTAQNPLVGWEDARIGSRFADLSSVYCDELAAIAHDAAKTLDMELSAGVYAAVTGPSLETAAERRYLRQIGADAVGMSTAMEVIAAAQCHLRVLAVSAIINSADGTAGEAEESLETVLKNAERCAESFAALLSACLEKIEASD